MNMEIYTTGGGYYLNDIFNYLAAYTSSANFLNLLWIGSMVGVVMAGMKLIFGGGFKDILHYFAVVGIVGAVCLGPRVNAVIIDETKGSLPVYSIVSNVPYGIALVGHLTSGVSYYITRHMETLLSTPTNITYQKSGMMFGATIMSQAAQFRSVSNILHENLVGFMDNCVIDAINLGHMDIDLVAGSGDLIATLDSTLPNSLSYYDTMTSSTTLCRNGWPVIKANITAEVSNVLNAKAASLYQDSPASGPANVAKLTGTLQDFQTLMGMSSASAVNTIQQSMLIHSLDDGISRFLANSGNSAAMGIYQSARAKAQTRSSYATIGANALTWVPILKIVFETIYYAAFPLALLMIMTPMGMAVLKGYIGGFVWIAGWEPISAILHSVVIKSATGNYREAGFVTTDGSVSDVVLSWANHFGIQAVEQDVGAMAGYLMMSVPFLSFAIMFGANRMMGLATSMLAVGQGAAMEAGREGASGNVSLGNVNMSNFASNKMNTSTMWDQGRSTGVMGSGATVTTNPDGSTSIGSGSALSNTGFSAGFTQGIRKEMSQRAEEAQSAVSAQTAEVSDYVSSSAGNLVEQGRNAQIGMASGTDYSTNFSQSEQRSFNEGWRNIEEFSKSHGLSTNMGMSALVAGTAGVGRDGAVQLGLNFQGQGRLEGSSAEQFAEAVKAGQSSEMQNSFNSVVGATEAIRASETYSSGESASNSERFSYDDGQRLAEGFSRRIQEANTLSTASSNLESQGVASNAALAQIAYQSLIDSGMTPSQASGVMNAKDISGLQSQGPVMNELVDDVSDIYSLSSNMSDPREGFAVNPGFNQPIMSANDAVPNMTDRANRVHGAATEMHDNNMEGTLGGLADGRGGAEQQFDSTQTGVEIGADRLVVGAMASRVGIPLAAQKQIDAAMGSTGASVVGGSNQSPLSPTDRDMAIRTVLGEAANQGSVGQAAVAHVIQNRVDDARWGSTVSGVVSQPKAFSAWNTDGSGNSIARNADPSSEAYQQAGRVVDAVFSGRIDDLTGGATHYYSPEGMDALVGSGYQSNDVPTWLQNEQEARGGPDAVIGDHIFTGKSNAG